MKHLHRPPEASTSKKTPRVKSSWLKVARADLEAHGEVGMRWACKIQGCTINSMDLQNPLESKGAIVDTFHNDQLSQRPFGIQRVGNVREIETIHRQHKLLLLETFAQHALTAKFEVGIFFSSGLLACSP